LTPDQLKAIYQIALKLEPTYGVMESMPVFPFTAFINPDQTTQLFLTYATLRNSMVGLGVLTVTQGNTWMQQIWKEFVRQQGYVLKHKPIPLPTQPYWLPPPAPGYLWHYDPNATNVFNGYKFPNGRWVQQQQTTNGQKGKCSCVG
jgi:hypothetical protein